MRPRTNVRQRGKLSGIAVGPRAWGILRGDIYSTAVGVTDRFVFSPLPLWSIPLLAPWKAFSVRALPSMANLQGLSILNFKKYVGGLNQHHVQYILGGRSVAQEAVCILVVQQQYDSTRDERRDGGIG